MKMPNLASPNQAGVGRLSSESQVGSYFVAPNAAPIESRRRKICRFMVPLKHASTGAQSVLQFGHLPQPKTEAGVTNRGQTNLSASPELPNVGREWTHPSVPGLLRPRFVTAA